MAKLAASIALHGLSLTIASIMVGAATLVACGSPVVDNIETASEVAKAATTRARYRCSARGRAVAGQMANLTARVAATAGRATANAQGRTVSLDMA